MKKSTRTALSFFITRAFNGSKFNVRVHSSRFFLSPSFEVGAKNAQDPLFTKSSLYVEIPIQRFEKWANFVRRPRDKLVWPCTRSDGNGGVSDKVNPVALESVYLIDSRGVRRVSPRAARSTHKSQISPEWCIPSWNPSTGGQISCYWYTDCASSQNIAPVCFLSK
jgi:hypothetical protein